MKLHHAICLGLCGWMIGSASSNGEPVDSARVVSRATLKFRPSAKPDKPFRKDLSAVVKEGDYLWLASDETRSLERLTAMSNNVYGDHQTFELDKYFNLPGKKEIDIEGLARQGDYLWVAGSHSLARDKEDLTIKEKGGNRCFLARLPMEKKDGRQSLADPEEHHGNICAARLATDDTGDELTQALVRDPLLGDFLALPSKDNGLDIEALAVLPDASADATIYLGLRGPVLRGYAVVLAFQVEADAANPKVLHLKKKDGLPYTRYFLSLGGTGIRDLAPDGNGNLLILTGPTMDLDGPIDLFRWKPTADGGGAEPVKIGPGDGTNLQKCLSLPVVAGGDHAEGVCLDSTDDHARSRVLVVYDSPQESTRSLDENGAKSDTDVQADIFQLP